MLCHDWSSHQLSAEGVSQLLLALGTESCDSMTPEQSNNGGGGGVSSKMHEEQVIKRGQVGNCGAGTETKVSILLS